MSALKIIDEKIILTRIRPQFCERDRLFCCLLRNDKLIEAVCEQASASLQPDAIYAGRVQKVLKGLSAAFVEVQPGLCCYLPLEKAKHPVILKKMPSDRIVQGDELLVQITKEASGSKLAAVTTNISFSGHYLVVTNENRYLSFSKKLTKEQRDRIKAVLPDFTDEQYGLIVRTNAADAPDEALLEEWHKLSAGILTLRETAQYRTCYTCFTPSVPFYLHYIKDAYTKCLSQIVTDEPEVYKALTDYSRQFPDYEKITIRFVDTGYPLAKAYNLEREIERALARVVHLKSGGYLVIDPTEAMTVIDVNTGKSVGTKDKKKHLNQVNQEAAAEIARQLRLRNLSGMILVDFINLDTEKEEEELLKVLRRHTAQDPVPVQVIDITKLGLVEITRKRSSRTLREMLSG